MPIGAFARLARLTVKAVRHYDAEDLLVPAHVDPHSAYRYYRADQVGTATTIAVLRGLDVPLPVVREVLAAPDPDAVAVILARERERLHAELTRREDALRSLDGLLRRPERVRCDIELTQRRRWWIRGVVGTVRSAALDADTAALCRAAIAADVPRGPVACGPLTAVFPLDLPESFETLVGVQVSHGGGQVVLPGGTWASVLHVGPHAELPMAYTALLEHVRESGRQPRDPVLETYLNDPTRVAPPELLTRVSVALD